WDKPILIFPGASGGNSWAPITYNPKTNLVYIPANIIPTAFTAKQQVWDAAKKELVTVGDSRGFYRPAGLERSGTLTAMDPATTRSCGRSEQSFRWEAAAGCRARPAGFSSMASPTGILSLTTSGTVKSCGSFRPELVPTHPSPRMPSTANNMSL